VDGYYQSDRRSMNVVIGAERGGGKIKMQTRDMRSFDGTDTVRLSRTGNY